MHGTGLIEVAARELRSGHIVHQDGDRFVVNRTQYATDPPVMMNGPDGVKCASRIEIDGRVKPLFAYPSAKLMVEKL